MHRQSRPTSGRLRISRVRRPSAATMAVRAADLLPVDAEQVVAALTEEIQGLRARAGAGPVVLGLSGGLDSAVLAHVAVLAVGAGAVRLLYLGDRSSSPSLCSNARLLAARWGVHLQERRIDDDLRSTGAYDTAAAVVTRRSAAVNRTLYRLYTVLTGESPFVTSLRAGPEPHAAPLVFGRDVHRRLALEAEAGFARRHVLRRRILEGEAAACSGVLLGAANRTEYLTGWFVRGGVDDLPHQPLVRFYKTEVRQLAAAFGVPEVVRRAAPSPDMMPGITDELALGLPYGTIDIVLAWMEGRVDRRAAQAAGVDAGDVRTVDRLVRLSAWKRSSNGRRSA